MTPEQPEIGEFFFKRIDAIKKKNSITAQQILDLVQFYADDDNSIAAGTLGYHYRNAYQTLKRLLLEARMPVGQCIEQAEKELE